MNAISYLRNESPMMLRACTAADLMMPNPKSIRAEADIAEALALFTEKGIAAAPVIDEAGRPIGVISRSDLLVHERECEKARLAGVEYFFSPDISDDGDMRPTKHTVADLMTPAIFAVSPETPVHQVIADMVGLHVHRLFVVDDDGILVGVISTMDVLKHLHLEP